MRANVEEGRQKIEKIKDEINQMINLGMVSSNWLKGGQSVSEENAKKALKLIESFEKDFYRKIEIGMVFKKDLPEIEKHLRKAVESIVTGDNKTAVEAIKKANQLTMKATL